MKTNILLSLTMATCVAAQAGAEAAKAPRAPRPPMPPIEIPGLPSTPAAAATLVVPGKADADVIRDTQEDLTVMGRILQKAVNGGEGAGKSAMGIAIQNGLLGGTAGPQNMYLDGFGALFILNVNYPLLAPGDKGVEPEEADKSNTEWEEARRELYNSGGPFMNLSSVFAFSGPSTEPYDADRVEDLKSALVEALKNAVHIRSLEGDESVVVVVNGRSGKGESRTVVRSGSGHSAAVAVATGGGQTSTERLILRAKKNDIEAFQKGRLNLEQFRKKVSEMVF